MKQLINLAIIILPTCLFAQKTDSSSQEKEIKAIELLVKKKLVERKADRLIFNVEQSVKAQGGTALDALKATPSVNVKNEEISLSGKGSVRIMVNGRLLPIGGQELSQYLKNIASADIDKIEVITQPPSKYDAEGNWGLINIVLKKSIKNNWNARLSTSYQQATYETLSYGANFSYMKNKFSVLATAKYTHGKKLYTNDIYYHYPAEKWVEDIFSKNQRNSLSSLLNLNYNISDKSSIGMQFLGHLSEGRELSINKISTENYANQSVLKRYNTYGTTNSEPDLFSFNLNYTQKFGDEGQKLSVDADFFKRNNPKVNDFNSDFQNYVTNNTQLTSAENNSYQSIKNYSLKADYELPLDWANLSFGGKTSSTTTESAVMTRFYNRTNNQLDLANDNLFEYTENIQALYLSANKQISEKIDAKIGLRGEYTQTKAKSISLDETNTNAYFKLFPTLYIAYTPNDNHTFSASYGRRIGRANFQQMNPARDYSTPKSYVLGNPFLQPSFINNYELGYSYKDLLNVQMYFGKMTNQLSQVTRHNPQEDSQIFRHENIADMTQAGGEFSLTFSPLKFWETSIETWFNYSETTPYDRSIYESKYYGWMVQSSMDNTFMLNSAKTLQATLTYGYHFPSKGIGRFDASSYLDIGFRYFALDKKLTLSLVFEDILRTASARHYDNTSNIPQAFLQYYDTQFARLSLSYEFGNKKISVKQRAIGNEEERNRSN